jgi:mono/diheme cytochrome c family protein
MRLQACLGLSLLACVSVRSEGAITPLELDRPCSECHRVRTPLTGEDWLARLRELGPLDKLTLEQQQEVLGLLHHHGSELTQIVQSEADRALFLEKCSLCHSADRAFIRELTPEQRRATLARMQARAPDWLSDAQIQTIVAFLERGAPGVQKPEHRLVDAVPVDVFRVRCGACHTLERAYLYLEAHGSDADWPQLVARMRSKAPEWISSSEAALIVDYLKAQKPQLPHPGT